MAEAINILKSKCTFLQGINGWSDQWNKVLLIKSLVDCLFFVLQGTDISIIFYNCGVHRSGVIDNTHHMTNRM